MLNRLTRWLHQDSGAQPEENKIQKMNFEEVLANVQKIQADDDLKSTAYLTLAKRLFEIGILDHGVSSEQRHSALEYGMHMGTYLSSKLGEDDEFVKMFFASCRQHNQHIQSIGIGTVSWEMKENGISREEAENLLEQRKNAMEAEELADCLEQTKEQIILGIEMANDPSLDYETDDNLPPDVNAETLQLAREGNPEAEYIVGTSYHQGIDCAQQNKWTCRAALHGHVKAIEDMYHAAHLFLDDKEEKLKWAYKGADAGSLLLQFHLGEVYRDGKGIPRNYAQAYKWFSLSASKGYEGAEKALNELEKNIPKEQLAEGQRLALEYTQKIN